MNSAKHRAWYRQPAIAFPWLLVFSLVIGLVILAFPIPDYEISLSRDSLDIPAGGEAIVLVSISLKHGYQEDVSLKAVSDSPIEARLSKSEISGGGHARLKINVPAGMEPGQHKVLVDAVSELERSKTTSLQLTIREANWNPPANQTKNDSILQAYAWKESINMIPYDERSYANVFGKVSNTLFYGYNAPWKIEGSRTSETWHAALKLHQARYASNVKSKYLFFDEAALRRAQAFWVDLQKISEVDLATVIEARLIDGEPESQPTYFFWDADTSVDVLYPEPFLFNGKPQLVFQALGNKQMHTLLRRSFDEKWEQARPVATLFDEM